jgi:putative membrane protein
MPFAVAHLPALNAVLNAASAALLLVGYSFIRWRRVAEHRRCMLSAFGASTVFLVE